MLLFLRHLVQASHDVVGVDAPLDQYGRALPAELVDDVEELQGPGVVGLVELEIERSHDVGPYGREGAHPDADASEWSFPASAWHPLGHRPPNLFSLPVDHCH